MRPLRAIFFQRRLVKLDERVFLIQKGFVFTRASGLFDQQAISLKLFNFLTQPIRDLWPHSLQVQSHVPDTSHESK